MLCCLWESKEEEPDWPEVCVEGSQRRWHLRTVAGQQKLSSWTKRMKRSGGKAPHTLRTLQTLGVTGSPLWGSVSPSVKWAMFPSLTEQAPESQETRVEQKQLKSGLWTQPTQVQVQLYYLLAVRVWARQSISLDSSCLVCKTSDKSMSVFTSQDFYKSTTSSYTLKNVDQCPVDIKSSGYYYYGRIDFFIFKNLWHPFVALSKVLADSSPPSTTIWQD